MKALQQAVNYQRKKEADWLAIYPEDKYANASEAKVNNGLLRLCMPIDSDSYSMFKDVFEIIKTCIECIAHTDTSIKIAILLKNGDVLDWDGNDETLEKIHYEYMSYYKQ